MNGLNIVNEQPDKAGISSKSIKDFLDRLYNAEIPMHGVLIVKDDKLVFEAYQKPYNKDSLHRMFSITKSMVSLAIGILADEGKISLDDYIVDYFPDKVPENVHPYIKAIKIRHMLTMTTAHHSTTYKLQDCDDWVKTFFEVEPSHYPGTFFSYDTSSSHTLAALVERLTGKELLAFLREKVLDDIGFSKEAYCIKDPMGVSMGGSGLMAKARDIMAVMRLVMAGGSYNGKQYISRDYIEAAVSRKVDNYAKSGTLEEMQGYGYQFWRITHNGYACYGMGGQLGICIPEKKLMIITMGDTQGRQGGVQLIYDAFWETIYKECDVNVEAQAVQYDGNTIYELKQIAINGIKSPVIHDINGKKIIFDNNENGFEWGRLDIADKEGTFTYKMQDAEERVISFGIGENVEAVFPYYNHRMLCSGGWTTENTFLIYAQIIDEYVGKVFIHLSFNGDNVGIMLRKIKETYYKEFDLFTSGKIQRD